MTRGANGRTHARRLVISASMLVAAACSTAPESSTIEPASTSSSTGSDTTSIEGLVLGGGNYPTFTVQAPFSWDTPDGHFVINDSMGSGLMGLSIWDVGRVPRDPCHWKADTDDPGPTVADLLSALVVQETREATKPRDVTLGGYDGKYLAWSVPADMVVTGDADFKGCDHVGNGHRDFVSWFGRGMGERYQQVAGQVDRLWVLDVEGQRLVVDATYGPDTTQAERDELDKIVMSLEFDAPAA